jgi:hypothetical protein
MKNLFKKLFIPSGEKTTVIAYKSWTVRWLSLKSDWEYARGGGTPQVEIFPSKEDAHKFAAQLKEAFGILKYDGDRLMKITVEENDSKLASVSA